MSSSSKVRSFPDTTGFRDVIQEKAKGYNTDCQTALPGLEEYVRSLSLQYFITKFCDNGGSTAYEFLSRATSGCTAVLCNKASKANTDQNMTPLYQELRYGHNTA
jgi:hypothetical protein